jgi:Bacterial CdiA-CT RNAse A domain
VALVIRSTEECRDVRCRLRILSSQIRRRLLVAVCIFCICGCGQSSAPATASSEEPRCEAGVKSIAVVDRYDLVRDEERGGHTLKKHVGQTGEQLAERLWRERNISAASTWTDLETAEETVAEALRAKRVRIDSWMRRGYPRPNLAVHDDAGRVIGRSLRRGENRSADCTGAVIVLRADGPNSYYVLTAYPEARE